MEQSNILTEALQRIPKRVRFWMLVVFAAIGVLVQILRIVEVDLAYDKIHEVLVLIGIYLGIQSAPNVPKDELTDRE